LTTKDYKVHVGWTYLEEEGEFISNEVKEEDSSGADV
jgi:hypothetical protein